MADNVSITAGTGTSIATDDIGGVQYQRVKVGLGSDGTAVDAVGGIGAADAGTQRVVSASDDPAVVALQIIDDWDETDRAKVNPIVGQAGVAAGAGAVGASTQRVTLASDDPAVAILGAAADAASATTTIKAALRAIATALGTTALDLGSGTSGTRTLRIFQDTAQFVGGSGAASAATQRVIAASDSPEVTNTATLAGAVTSARMAVNLISGQAGIAAGSGINGATVPRVTIATDDQSAVNLNNALVGDYETVAASQTAQTLGATGAAGDYLSGVLIVPATTSPGNVIILDNATSITIFAGGASSVSNLVPFMVPLGMKSVSGAWKITTGANVSAIGIGNFT